MTNAVALDVRYPMGVQESRGLRAGQSQLGQKTTIVALAIDHSPATYIVSPLCRILRSYPGRGCEVAAIPGKIV